MPESSYLCDELDRNKYIFYTTWIIAYSISLGYSAP